MALNSVLSEPGEEERVGEVLFPHTSASQPELEIKKKLALERCIDKHSNAILYHFLTQITGTGRYTAVH